MYFQQNSFFLNLKTIDINEIINILMSLIKVTRLEDNIYRTKQMYKFQLNMY